MSHQMDIKLYKEYAVAVDLFMTIKKWLKMPWLHLKVSNITFNMAGNPQFLMKIDTFKVGIISTIAW